jgi:hypothetical protein
LLGILVVGPRSDEHCVADERELSEERARTSEALLDEARARNAALLELLRGHGATLES